MSPDGRLLMIEWTRSPVWLVQAFDAALPSDASIERRQMFGYPAAFVRGNMAAGLFREQLIVRLPERRRAELLAEPGSTPFEPMPGRPMKEYVVVSPALVSDSRELKRWIGEAATYAASLPARASRAAKKTPKKAAKTAAKTAAKKVGQKALKGVKTAAKATKRATKTAAKKATSTTSQMASKRTRQKGRGRAA
jgi:TfoX/Sxy family transcriptional regulator of competence genes